MCTFITYSTESETTQTVGFTGSNKMFVEYILNKFLYVLIPEPYFRVLPSP